MRKKILFAAYSLDIGGIETALINLLDYLDKTNKYDITLVLEKKQGILLNSLNKNIRLIEYSPSYNRIFGKILNAIKRIKFTIKYKNKFDASFAYATYCKMAAFTTQVASKNSNLWVHSSYLDIFDGNEIKYKQFFKEINVDNFRNIIFVSNKSKVQFEKVLNKNNTIVCNNIINYKKIKELSKEKIQETKPEEFAFLYVGRIVEESKKISRLLEASKKLKERGMDFKVFVVGDGKDLEKSKKYVNDNNLNKYVEFLGTRINPYPYYKISNALILVSENEGYSVVYNEAKVLDLPILTTDVSDSKLDIDNKYGIVCKQNVNDIVEKMEFFIKNGFYIKEKFEPQKYNEEIIKKVEDIIDERN